jgi:hypothetical protein
MIRVAAGLLSVLASLAVSSPAAASQPIIVTRESQALPTGCTTARLAVVVDGLFEAFNAGEWGRVDEAFAAAGPAPPSFTLLSWQQDVVRERERVTPYLAALRARGEQLRLLALLTDKEANGVATSVAVTYAFERPGGFGWGKGLIDCQSQRIWQWAMGPRAGELVLPCPKPAGWSPTGPVIACTAGPNARALSPEFRIRGGSATLPRPCAPRAAKQRLNAALRVFNEGEGVLFAGQFATGGVFHPYTVERPITGRTRLAEFVTFRYRAGDGWTATALDAPRRTVLQQFGATRLRVAVYRLSLRLSSTRKTPVFAPTRIVIDCRSGLIHRWTGPRLSAP